MEESSPLRMKFEDIEGFVNDSSDGGTGTQCFINEKSAWLMVDRKTKGDYDFEHDIVGYQNHKKLQKLCLLRSDGGQATVGGQFLSDQKELTHVWLGPGIKNVKYMAFYKCGLSHLYISSSVEKIDYEAFGLKGVNGSINIDVNVAGDGTSIASDAFKRGGDEQCTLCITGSSSDDIKMKIARQLGWKLNDDGTEGPLKLADYPSMGSLKERLFAEDRKELEVKRQKEEEERKRKEEEEKREKEEAEKQRKRREEFLKDNFEKYSALFNEYYKDGFTYKLSLIGEEYARCVYGLTPRDIGHLGSSMFDFNYNESYSDSTQYGKISDLWILSSENTKKVNIGANTFKAIGSGAGLRRMCIGPNVRSIAGNAFGETKVKSLYIANGVEKIESNAFTITGAKGQPITIWVAGNPKIDAGAFKLDDVAKKMKDQINVCGTASEEVKNEIREQLGVPLVG